MKRVIIIVMILAILAAASAEAWEYVWGTDNGGECAWGAGSCGSVGGPPPPPPAASSLWDVMVWDSDVWG